MAAKSTRTAIIIAYVATFVLHTVIPGLLVMVIHLIFSGVQLDRSSDMLMVNILFGGYLGFHLLITQVCLADCTRRLERKRGLASLAIVR